jgi:signal transduction histidine kinase
MCRRRTPWRIGLPPLPAAPAAPGGGPKRRRRFPRCRGRGRRPRRGPSGSRGRAGGIAALFLAACLWRRAGGGPSAGRGPSAGSGPATGATPSLALPVWSATPRHLERLALTVGPAWLGGFLTTVTDAARRAGQDLTRLQIAAERAAALRRTARSRLPAAAALALRQPVLTARGLAERLRLSPQAALGLLNQLVAAGVLKEATGRAAWRAFVVA